MLFRAMLIMSAYILLAAHVNGQTLNLAVIAQTGLGGGGGESNGSKKFHTEWTYVRFEGSKEEKIDLGQAHCIKTFNGKFTDARADAALQKINGYIFYGISQGSATIPNWLGKKDHQEQEGLAKLVFLEGVLGSGNNAILNSIERFIKPLSYMPFVRLWGPWAAKCLAVPHYNPYGMQALDSAKKISPKIPIIIMHHVDDKTTIINDARRLYCQLQKQGSTVYFFEIEAHDDSTRKEWIKQNTLNLEFIRYLQHDRLLPRLLPKPLKNYVTDYVIEWRLNNTLHTNALYFDKKRDEKIIKLFQIYRKHGLIKTEEAKEDCDLSELQPPVEDVQRKIESSERSSRYLRNTIDFLSIVGFVYAIQKTSVNILSGFLQK